MDLLSQTVVGVHAGVRAAIYETALRPGVLGCFGYLIGLHRDFTRPEFAAALVVATTSRGEEFREMPTCLRSRQDLARRKADDVTATVVGVFAAWDDFFTPRRNERLGLLVDVASELQLPFAVFFPTDGGETHWRSSIYLANRFPHETLPSTPLPNHRSFADPPRPESAA